jgi:isopenicillin-N epimerase
VLSIPAAIEFMDRLGWERLRRHNHQLVSHGQSVVSTALGLPPPVYEARFESMAIVELPRGSAATEDEALAIQARLYERARVEAPFTVWHDRCFLRLSAHAYNRPADYERLADALPGVLRETHRRAHPAT